MRFGNGLHGRDKAQWVEAQLTAHYGARPYDPSFYDTDLVGALVATILSQHTSDLNSGRAFARLKATFPAGWDQVREAQPEEIANAIRQGGLADTKAVRIKSLLGDIRARNSATNLDILRDMADGEAMEYLTSFHGVGPKTAACVLMFNLGRPVIAVDTHVHRVSIRVGLVAAKTSPERTQGELLEQIGPSGAYSFHVHLIEHGRGLCHSQRPACGACPLARGCDYFHEQHCD